MRERHRENKYCKDVGLSGRSGMRTQVDSPLYSLRKTPPYASPWQLLWFLGAKTHCKQLQIPGTLSWHHSPRSDIDNVCPFRWDIRQIIQAQGPEKVVVSLQEARHVMKPSLKGQAVSPPCVVAVNAEYDFSCVLLQGWIFITPTDALASTPTPSDFKRGTEEGEMSFCCQPALRAGGRVELLQLQLFQLQGCGRQHQAQSQPPGAIQGAQGFLLPVFWHRKPRSMTLAQDTRHEL